MMGWPNVKYSTCSLSRHTSARKAASRFLALSLVCSDAP